VVRLARLIIAPGVSEAEAGMLGPLLLAVETGTLTVRVLGPAVLARGGASDGGPQATTVPSGTAAVLGPGDGLVLPPGTHHVVQNGESAPAVVLALAFLPEGAGTFDTAWPWVGSSGIAAQLLADGTVADLPPAPVGIAVGRLTLAPGEGLAADGPAVPRLIVVEAGSLQLATTGEPPAVLAPGQGAVIPHTSGLSLRNVGGGPLVALLVTIAAPARIGEEPWPDGLPTNGWTDPFGVHGEERSWTQTKQIGEVVAGAPFLSLPAVKRHLTTILGNIGVPSRAEATAYARSHGLT
jgi:mannose-6-phosphate isomerase-like protein (cupin superfamily)